MDRLVKSFNAGMLPSLTNVAGQTLLIVPPMNKTTVEGEPVEFDCVTKDSTTIVTWFYMDTEISKIEVKKINIETRMIKLKYL